MQRSSPRITPAKGAFVANVKPEHVKQLALKNFFRQFATRQTNATSAEITPAKGAFVANVKPEHVKQLALKTFSRQVATSKQTQRPQKFHLPKVLLWQM